MKRILTGLGIAVMGLLVSCVASAQGSSVVAPPQVSERQLVHLRGMAVDRRSFGLMVEPGELRTNAIRVYSEPSHTLLLLLIDSQFAASEEGRTWQREAPPIPTATPTMMLPIVHKPFLFYVDPRIATDPRVAVWIIAEWAPGLTRDVLVADGSVGVEDFEFTTYQVLPFNPSSMPDSIRHCCSSPHCSLMCAYCPGPEFTCCLQGPPDCCKITCGVGDGCVGCHIIQGQCICN